MALLIKADKWIQDDQNLEVYFVTRELTTNSASTVSRHLTHTDVYTTTFKLVCCLFY